MDRPRIAVEIFSQVVIELKGIRAHCQAADFKNQLVAARRMDRSAGNKELPSGNRVNTVHILLVINFCMFLFRLLDFFKEFVFINTFTQSAIGLCPVSGSYDVVAFILCTELIEVLHAVFSRRMDLNGHIAV